MKTLSESFRATGSSAYWGERGEWLIALSVHRDSDALTRSNFAIMQKTLTGLAAVKEWTGDNSPVSIERASHWAVGWVDYLLIDPACAEATAEATRQLERLENYPILDEGHFSALGDEEAQAVWRDCYQPKERVKYIRAHRSQFDFRDMADLLGCVRGKYFAGYASELLT